MIVIFILCASNANRLRDIYIGYSLIMRMMSAGRVGGISGEF